MSIVSVVYIAEGIVLSADSRLTRTRDTIDTDGKVIKEKYALSDNAQKIVLLGKCPVGIASFGNAMIGGKTISDYIRLFEINHVNESDTPETVASKLLEHKDEFTGTYFYVCGYYQDIPYVFSVNTNGINRENVNDSNRLQYGLLWGGQPEALIKLVRNDPQIKIDYNVMPLKDGIDLAEFMIDVTIKYQRFSDRIQTCGGPIDVLVLTKDEAFWYKNKLKNEG